eukprot:a4453_3.p2 GENE.a4453_3~~a4453_3.p2  ORF type:complete len:109 (-),score=35.96 a4453_3:76-372(-)
MAKNVAAHMKRFNDAVSKLGAGDYATAGRELALLLREQKAQLGEWHRDTWYTVAMLAQAMREMGRSAKAKEMLDEFFAQPNIDPANECVMIARRAPCS